MQIGSLTGSLQRTIGNASFLVAGSNVSISTGSNGQVTNVPDFNANFWLGGDTPLTNVHISVSWTTSP